MEFLYHWGLFLLDTITLVVAILLVISGIAAIAAKNKEKISGKLIIKKINHQFDAIIESMDVACLDKRALKKSQKARKKQQDHQQKQSDCRSKLFIIDFTGDLKASAVTALRHCITAIIISAEKTDHVLLRLESPGGMVPGYGLAAAQLERLKAAGIKLTVAVDKVAASGGYMMAAVANEIIAAPFAVLGSIGVVYQLPNFHRLLKKNAVDFEQITAGTYKRTLTVFGENTKQDRVKVQEEVDQMQDLFKQHITAHRPQLDIETVATGEHWYGTQALAYHLVDRLQTSDDFVLEARNQHDLFEIEYRVKENLRQKLSHGLSNFYAKLIEYNDYG